MITRVSVPFSAAGRFAARQSDLAFGLAVAVRPAGLVSGVNGARLRSKRRAEGAPLTLGGPARFGGVC